MSGPPALAWTATEDAVRLDSRRVERTISSGQLSSMPMVSASSDRSRPVVAGVMRSTIELGKATLLATQMASSG